MLPRGIDHGVDMAVLESGLGKGEDLHTLVLDFSNAFMTIPLHAEEQRFNCSHTGFDLVRRR